MLIKKFIKKHSHVLFIYILIAQIFSHTTSFATTAIDKEKNLEYEKNGIEYTILPLTYIKPSWKTLWKVPVAIYIHSNEKKIKVNKHNLFNNITFLHNNILAAHLYAAVSSLGGSLAVSTLTILNCFRSSRYYLENYNFSSLVTGEAIKQPSVKNLIVESIMAPVVFYLVSYFGTRLGEKLVGGKDNIVPIEPENPFESLSYFISKSDLEKLKTGTIIPELNYTEIE
jgi:hypothetical protein